MDICKNIRAYCTQSCSSVISAHALATIRVLIKQIMYSLEHRVDVRDNILSWIFCGYGLDFKVDNHMIIEEMLNAISVQATFICDTVINNKMKALRYCAIMVKYGDIRIEWLPINQVMEFNNSDFNNYIENFKYLSPVLGNWSTSQYLPDKFISLL